MYQYPVFIKSMSEKVIAATILNFMKMSKEYGISFSKLN